MLTLESATAEKLQVTITTTADPTAGPVEFAVSSGAGPGIVGADPADIIGLLPSSSVKFWSLPTFTDAHTSAEWTLGQPDTLVNLDGTPSKGYWYPNVDSAPAYSDADYAFETGPDGQPWVRTRITDAYATSHAAQLWRRFYADVAPGLEGTPLGQDLYLVWQAYFPDEIFYLNTNPLNVNDFGFTNHRQHYSTAGSNTGPIVSIGAGKNLGHNEHFRWHFDMNDRGVFDLAHLVERPIRPRTFYTMVERVRLSTGADGRWEIWECVKGEEAVKLLDYTGPIHNTGSTAYGISWGNYGHLQTPDTIDIGYRQVGITTENPLPYLLAGSEWQAGSWASTWDSTTGQATALTPLVGAGQALAVAEGDYDLYARWTVGTERPVRLVDRYRFT